MESTKHSPTDIQMSISFVLLSNDTNLNESPVESDTEVLKVVGI